MRSVNLRLNSCNNYFIAQDLAMNTKTKNITHNPLINSSLINALVIATSLLVANMSYAKSEQVSVSLGQLEQSNNLLTKNELLAKTQNTSSQNTLAHFGVERSQFISNKSRSLVTKHTQQLTNNSNSTLNSTISNQSHSYDGYQFSIFNAQSSLLTDDDLDGYYQGFSITFDADYLRYDDYDTATVYAEMYLSKDGGPWLHYYTTEAFTIHSDADDDFFEVVTTLVDGYTSDNYNVLIDLYEVGYSDIVATYSSDDSNALYALPLESANYDIYQPDVVIVETYSEGGSFAWLLLLPAIVLAYRRKKV